MKNLIFLTSLIFLISACSSSKTVEIKGGYEYNKLSKTYKIRHKYNGKVQPYNFIADLQKGCYEFHDEHDRWPKDKADLVKFMRKEKMETKRILSLDRLSFDHFIHELHIKFSAKAPKQGILRLPKPTH